MLHRRRKPNIFRECSIFSIKTGNILYKGPVGIRALRKRRGIQEVKARQYPVTPMVREQYTEINRSRLQYINVQLEFSGVLISRTLQ